jgi:hypothetical protein
MDFSEPHKENKNPDKDINECPEANDSAQFEKYI